MTKSEAEALATTSLPCPFCGERLVAAGTVYPHLTHPVNPNCFFQSTYNVILYGEIEVDMWNRRTEPKR